MNILFFEIKILSDAYTRWLKIRGYDVIFSTGTDEHGIKIQ
jgi:methionyl-tRNA synthetase